MHLFISSEITYNLFSVRFFLFTDKRSQHPPPTRPLKTSPHRKETASERMNNYSVMSFSVPGAFNPIKLKSLFLTSHERTYSISFTPTISSCSTRSECRSDEKLSHADWNPDPEEPGGSSVSRNLKWINREKRLDSWWDSFSIYVLWTTADCSVVSSYPEPIMIQTIGCAALTCCARFSRASSLEEFVTRFSS